jgi:putative SOS response-associated peptidase YedK
MCGRLKLPEDIVALKQELGIRWDELPDYEPRYNLAPASPVPVVGNRGGARSLEWMRWGLIPSWATDERNLYATFNVDKDEIVTKPVFRGAWKTGRRCLVIADGFYEWRKTDKQPFFVSLASKKPMLLAGLWDEWTPRAGAATRSCTIITTEANTLMAQIHDRMPVIVAQGDWPAWLGEGSATDPLLLLKPFPADQMTMWPVDKRISNVKNEDRQLPEPIKLAPPVRP